MTTVLSFLKIATQYRNAACVIDEALAETVQQ